MMAMTVSSSIKVKPRRGLADLEIMTEMKAEGVEEKEEAVRRRMSAGPVYQPAQGVVTLRRRKRREPLVSVTLSV